MFEFWRRICATIDATMLEKIEVHCYYHRSIAKEWAKNEYVYARTKRI